MRAHLFHRAWFGVVCACVPLGCSQGDSAARPAPIFGGQGADLATPNEKPLPDATVAADAAGPCGRMAPASDTALLDDFEDGDGKLFRGFEREGWWYSGSDNTEGSLIKPVGAFAAELLPAAEANKENRFAAHLVASGQKQWGVIWGSGLSWVRKGIKCPLNIGAFGGLRFRAKGPGTIRISLSVPEVMPKESGGTCTEGCYDSHGKLFVLSNAWDSYELRWERLQQGGWGTEARFTPERVINLGVGVDTQALPIDFWIDDLELLPKSAGAAPTTASK